jgi:hypothetical protein
MEEKELLGEVLRKLNLLLDEKNGLKLSGQGMIANNTEETNKILNKMNNTLMHLENKVEALLSPEAQERHEQIKRRFNKY